MFSYVSVDARVPADHPIRKLRELVDGMLAEKDGLFEQRYAKTGRPSRIDDAVRDHSTFSFDRDRLFDEEVAQSFFITRRWAPN
jgi:hypothetical protein